MGKELHMKTGFMVIMATMAFYGRAGEGYADLVDSVKDAVVHIRTTQEIPESHGGFDFFRNRGQGGPREFPRGSGTGFVISPDGYIVTNRHVVADSKSVTVVIGEGKMYEAELIGTDDSIDVALIKVDVKNLTFLKTGNSDKMRLGDPLLAMGYPLELGFTVTTGIVSGIGRNLRNGGIDLATYIQTDADITFGNSGGPLLNTKGEVVGINTFILSQGETLGFAIPSNLFINSVEQLKKYGHIKRGALGIQVGDLLPEAQDYYDLEYGAVVNSVTPGFPAEKAGVRADDVILKVNGIVVKNAADVVAAISSKPPGAKVGLTVFSDGESKEMAVVLGDRGKLLDRDGDDRGSSAPPREEEEPEVFDDLGLGFSVTPIGPAIHELEDSLEGMKVEDVYNDSLAARRGLASGDVITHVNRKQIRSVQDIRDALKPLEKGDPIKLRVVRFTRVQRSISRSDRSVFVRKE
jgi:serine protease Do